MTERQGSLQNRPTYTDPTPPLPEDDAISLKPLVSLLVAYRRVIGLSLVGAVALSGVFLIGVALNLPSERVGSLTARLLFDGAVDNRYPNGTSFSPAEIIATPVLSEVYRANELQRFGRYDDFKDSMAVLHSSMEQDLLAASYLARLVDTKLTAVDRTRLEDEFRKKHDAIRDPVFTLSLRRSERVTVMPAALIEKVLNDTLATWAKQADELKGAMHFNVPVFSRGVLKPEILSKDYLMAADDLRVQARRAEDVAQKLMLVPGASTLRTQKDRISLSDVTFAIADIQRNQIEPVVYLIQERGLTSDAQAAVQYLHGHVVELRLERDAARARIQVLQDALQGYMAAKATRSRDGSAGAGGSGRAPQGFDTQTVIPQISDTFLDRLIEMSTQAGDADFRQRLTDRVIRESEALPELERATAYYEGLEKTIRVGSREISPAQAQAVRAQLRDAFDALVLAVDRLMNIYEELSAQRLNPAAGLYAVTGPFALQTQSALTPRTVNLVLAFAALFTLVAAPLACSIHQSRTRRSVASRLR